MAEKRLKWGILGTSFISEVMAEAIRSSDTGELVAVASRQEDKAASFAAMFALERRYLDYQQLLDDSLIDIVYLGLPNHLHLEWIVKAAAAGKHILCEKPLVLTVQEAQQAITAVRQADILCMEALMYIHHPFIRELKTLIESGALGTIRQIQGYYCANISHLANPVAGGCIRNLGCYPVSLTRFFLDAEPVNIVSLGRVDDHGGDRQANIILQFPQGTMASLSTADDLEMVWQYRMTGDEGSMDIISNPWLPQQNGNVAIIKDKNGNDLLRIERDAEKPLYSYQIDVLGHYIRGDADEEMSLLTLENSLLNVRVLEKWLHQVHEKNALPAAVD
ncbi:Gfo/Idh/MocA family protein [Legionella spiritensis]|uniref:Gfo/Idh/MocA family protein n=1 Tax=Legionella spiritensis TaxID=452 RepID=UPI000F6C5B26|nr:Gfo/Idh/MocA family oxidoreductase [Legionella spiritensis]VEG92010.1 oxidoreductase [Legionella spiritensis]